MSYHKPNNRLIYDECNYQEKLESSVSPLRYQLYGGKFVNCNNCSTENDVCGSDKTIQTNLTNKHVKRIELENMLRGFNPKNCGCSIKTDFKSIEVDSTLSTPSDMCNIVPSREKLVKF